MSSINTLCALSVHFKIPWLLFLLIPAYALMLWPYFRLSKQHRRTTSRVVSLVLHSVIILLCVFMVCGMSFERTSVSIKNDVIILVDLSDSNKASEDDMNAFIKSVVDETEDGYRLGIITFANGQVYSAELNSNAEQTYKNYIESADKPEGNASDIASALMFAREKLADRSSGRIILLSDGLETDGSALAAVKILADEGTRVDTKLFSPTERKEEVQINNLEVPQTMSVGETAQITVTFQSASACTASITLYDNGQEVYENPQEVSLSGGTEFYPLNYTLIIPGFHEFCVVVETDQDTVSENNRYYSYLSIQSSHRLLLVEGRNNDAKSVEEVLQGSYDDVTRIGVDELPKTYEELCRFSEVVFANVANADLPAGFDDNLTRYVEEFGGGFYTIGGNKAYQEDDMKDTKYQELLPVEASTEVKSLGLLLVIDCSGSMTTNNRIDLAKEAAMASVEALDTQDYVGLIKFNSTAELLVDMWPVSSRKNDVIKKISQGLDTATGTQYYNAVSMARTTLSTFEKTTLKHVIFLTDGEPVDANKAKFMNEIDLMAKADITLSTIALGASVPIETAKEMAERGGGRFYDVTQERDLKNIMVKETKTAAIQYENEKLTEIEIKSITSAAVAGITELPKLSGFYGTKLKNGANMVLGYKDSPIYAEWSRGAGRVGSFMCNLNGTWSAELLSSPSGQKFIVNSIGSLLPKIVDQTYADVRAEIVNNNLSAELRVYTDAREGETVTAQLISPYGDTSDIALEKQTGSLYAGLFDTRTSGIYKVRIIREVGAEATEIYAYTAFSYSQEYAAFADDTDCFQFLENISQDGNGSMLFSADNLFGKKNEVIRSTFNPQLTFLIISIVLFLLDIVVRKFKIKWPHEIIRERRNNTGGTEHEKTA